MRIPAIAVLLLATSLVQAGTGAGDMGPHLPDMMLQEADAALWENDTVVGKEDSRLVAAVLAVALGPFGAHRLYLGTVPKVAIIYGVTFGGFGVLAVIDLVHILCTKDLGPYRNNDKVFMWANKRRDLTPP